MDNFRAVAVVEGFEEAENEEEYVEALQWLHDTGLGHQLQGFFGRTLRSAIENEIISE